ncbi:phosphohydrolase [Rhodoferax sp. GW822-FHT02A01]|uniref:phosphohydrolase n=1 Tax=Rhodoferax sp. GW822-FHT02A01 TaxID=3141537 RepID=UPI00315DD3DB
MHSPLDLLELYVFKGNLAYDGEGISQIEHAWQCGQLALQAGATPELQLASWLHDVGHLMTDLHGTPTLRGIDDQHENVGAQTLLALWGPAVAEPVRLHVHAKRYLVATHPGYVQTLSPDSVRSLALQGGPMGEQECAEFRANAFALAAQQLRSWDDNGKRVGWFAPDVQQAHSELQALMQRVSARLGSGLALL